MAKDIDVGQLTGIGFDFATADAIEELTRATGYDQNPSGATVYAGKCILAGLLGVSAGLLKLARAVEHMAEERVR
jgi:MFS superfamily sulfate permease-like transporter